MLARIVLLLVLLLPCTCLASSSARRLQAAPHPDVMLKSRVYEWLKALPARSGNKVISGQMSWSNAVIDRIQLNYGKKPGLRGFDWYEQSEPAADALAWAKAGGMIQLMYHMPNPFNGNSSYSDPTSGNWTNLVTNGTTENTNWKASLDKVAATISMLQNYNAVVLWRPFHEMNGNWFWWGSQSSTTAEFIAAWQYMYSYLTTIKGLRNIIWVYGPNTGTSSNVIARYPGDSYADIVSLDVYGTAGFSNEADLAAAFPTKPFAVAEYGGCAPSGCAEGGVDISGLPNSLPARTIFWMNWESMWTNHFGLDEPNAGTASIFANPLVITLDEMPAFGTYWP